MDTRATIEIEIKNAAGPYPRGPGNNPYQPYQDSDHWKSAQYHAQGGWHRDLKDQVKMDTLQSRISKVKQEMYHEERYKVDDEYRQQHDDREAKKEETKTRQSAYRMMIGGYAAGLTSVGRIAGGYVGGGPSGAIVAALNVAGEKIASGIQTATNQASNIFSFDGMQQMQGFSKMIGDFYSNIPLLGPIINSLQDSFFKLVGTVDQAANNLAQYSGILAYAQAQIEVRRLYREMDRAQTLGPKLANFMFAKENLAEKIEDIMVKFAPPIIDLLTGILDWARSETEFYTSGFTSIVNFLNEFPQVAVNINAALPLLMRWLGAQGNQNPDASILIDQIIGNIGNNLPVNNPQSNPQNAPGPGGGAAPFGNIPNVP